jgi:hypothetical protein
MPPHRIKRGPKKRWKKGEWKTLSKEHKDFILWVRRQKINDLVRIAEETGVNAIYPSDDDDLNWRPRPWNH